MNLRTHGPVLALSLLAAGCGTSDTTSNADAATPPADMAGKPRPPVGAPLTTPMNQWTWVDFPDSMCDDGTPTGIGVNLTGSKNVLIYLQGGGACWDYLTCVQLPFAVHGPYGANEFMAGFDGTVLGTVAGNPYAGWNVVYVPYCTSDLHAGHSTKTFMSGGDSRTFHFNGRANMTAFLKRIAATWPSAEKVVVSGSSAGGFGAGLNADLAFSYFPDSQRYLVDDSGPAMIGPGVPSFLRTAAYDQWNVGEWMDVLCPQCKDDFSQFYNVLAATYPKSRGALLSYEQDGTISRYFVESAAQFQTDLNDLATMRLDALPNMKYFYENGVNHTMLLDPTKHTVNGVSLLPWLTQMTTDDPAWTSVKP